MAQSQCTYIENDKMRFLIFDAPNDTNLPTYMEDFRKYNVQTVVRVCDATYAIEPLKQANIEVHDWPFPDGDAPPDAVIDRWLALLKTVFETKKDSTVGIHCVAGLGRAPVLVSIALIDLGGMDALEAVSLIRGKRRGAINQRQLQFLQGYKRRSKDKKCSVM